MAKILCVDDETTSLQILERSLESVGHESVLVHSVEEGLGVLERGGIDLIVSDYLMPGTDGLAFIRILRERQLDIPLIMVTGHSGIQHAVEAIKAGAIDYIAKPVRPRQLGLAVDQALEFVRLRRENVRFREELAHLRGSRHIIGESLAMQRVIETLTLVASTRATVLLQGESGTGKELLARLVHSLSGREDETFVSLNCAALPENLIESTLFGHEKGAFTGASSQVKGAFERAHRGTLLLDEISEMRLDLQAKLLRVLQEREFERVGGSTPIRIDARIVATTNRNLAEEVEAGRFREDLYYRLAVVPILVPPLRERLEDVPLLVQFFAAKVGKEVGREITAIEPEAMELLQGYAWPGNVRELAHMVERAVILGRGSVLGAEAFDRERLTRTEPLSGGAPAHVGASGDKVEPIFLGSLNIRDAEEILMSRALEVTGQNRTRAADILGISVRTLRNRLNT